MNNILKDHIKYSLYPLLDVKEKHYDGILFTKNKLCDSCLVKQCLSAKNKKDYNLKKCDKELLYFKITIHNKTFIMYGMRNDYNMLSRLEKKKYESKIYCSNLNSVKRWVDKVNENFNIYENNLDETEQKNSIFIHDIKKVYSIILRKVESFIKNNCDTPSDLDACIKNTDKDIMGIYKTINLLEYQFNIIDFVSNPDSAKFGNIKQIHIYKVVDKLVRIFQGFSNNNIKIIGSSFNKLYIYNSFVTLMFILIDNAIKYSHNNQDIEIHIDDLGYDKTKIKVISFSPYLTPAERVDIFDKHYRGENITKIIPDGQGIGLYVASNIADVLETKVDIYCSNSLTKINNINYCNVSFEFELNHID
ncbi:MAG: ATP-binding protein [Arcobacter sp.]|uniref:ATP-binding protein n=1 Tax=Arcobacter sp. TaxID=1872629 RepID=UPI003CFD821A